MPDQQVGVDQSEQARRLALQKQRYRRSAKGQATLLRQKGHASRAVQRRLKLLKKYGITVRQYDLMFALQDGKCVGCGRPPKTRRLAVEHDHHTGRVRGLACHNCNRHLIAKNTAETARWLVAYLSSDFDGRNL